MTAKGCIFAPSPPFCGNLEIPQKVVSDSEVAQQEGGADTEVTSYLTPLAYLHCKVRAAVKKCINLGPFPLSKVADMLA